MYEGLTFDVLKERMLERIPSSFDKREGSLIYNAIAPVAVELVLIYRQLDSVRNNCYADTADMEALTMLAKPFGISPKGAINAVLYAEFLPGNIDVTGKRFSCEELTYVVTECVTSDSGYSMCKAMCEQAGEIGNKYQTARLVPIEYIAGLETAFLGEVITQGSEEETLEEYRDRVFSAAIAFGGNIADYKRTTLSIPGVGGVKVVPAQPTGTVKLYIHDDNYYPTSKGLISAVQAFYGEYADGRGLPPIGHTVEVHSAIPAVVDVSCNWTLEAGYTTEQVLPYFEEKVKAYFAELRQKWGEQGYSERIIVSISRIYYDALSIKGVKEAVVYLAPEGQVGSNTNYALAPLEIPFIHGELGENNA